MSVKLENKSYKIKDKKSGAVVYAADLVTAYKIQDYIDNFNKANKWKRE